MDYGHPTSGLRTGMRSRIEDTVEGIWFVNNTNGLLQKTLRFRGTIKHRMDLHRYPFDSTSIPIRLESQHHPANDVELKVVNVEDGACAEPSYAKERGVPLLTGGDFAPPVYIYLICHMAAGCSETETVQLFAADQGVDLGTHTVHSPRPPLHTRAVWYYGVH